MQSYRDAKPGPFWAGVGVASLSIFGMVAAFGTAPSTQGIEPVRQSIVEQLALPPLQSLDVADEIFVLEERIQRGDTVASLLSRLGVQEASVMSYLRQEPKTDAIFRQMSPGKQVTARVNGIGELQSLIFPLNGGKDLALMVERTGDEEFATTEAPLSLETHVFAKSAEIRYSLFGAADAADIPDGVAVQLADIFGGDIDFHRDIRKGDRFSVVYESVNHLGKMVRTGRILAAEFVNDGHVFQAVWYGDENGHGGYYTPEGRNLRKAFLRSPLEFSRITSGFSNARFHPVLKEIRAHRGIDYGAPIGTRIRATGDGVVDFVGVKGGYGKMVVLRHRGTYSTVYGHMSGFASGLHRGSRVSQGDVIGYVGMTGLATGPHLHYEFRINGVHQNPLAVTLPESPPLAQSQLPRFREFVQQSLARLEMTSTAPLAQLD